MSPTVEQIVTETRQWPADVVADLVDRITLAKHGGLNAEREAAWTEAALRRCAELCHASLLGSRAFTDQWTIF